MSEYQYYEFLAIDRPLNKEQLADLRALSTRATITPTRFQNVYNYGDFRGDPERLMQQYFDAFVYVANWGTHWFMLRLPMALLTFEAVRPYAWTEGLEVSPAGEHLVLSFRSDAEEAEWEEGEEWMASLAPLRADLASGDLRALYLGWLAGIQESEYEDDDSEDGELEWEDDEPSDEEVERPGGGSLAEEVEPPVPPGLGQLSAPLEALSGFLRLDRDLLAVAAAGSGPLAAPAAPEEWQRWLRGLSAAEKDAYLLRLLARGDNRVPGELALRFRQARTLAHPPSGRAPARRTVGQLRVAASKHAARRRREEAERQEQERERAEREAAVARAKYLASLAGREEELWLRVERLVEAKRAKEYDEAVRLVVDLRDLAARAGTLSGFSERLSALRERYAKRPAFLERLDKTGLVGQRGK